MAGLNVALPKPTILQPSEQENQLVQGYQQEHQNLEQRVAPIQAERTKLEGEIGQAGNVPPPPKLQPIPQYQSREADSGTIMTFMTVATVLGALGSKITRTGITGALTAAGSAISGFNEGQLERSKIDIANFNTKMRAVVQQNNTMLAEYKAVLEDRKLTLAQKMSQYNILAARYQDEIAMSAMKRGDLKFELERIDKLRSANWQAEQLWERTNAALMAQAIRIDAQMKMRGVGGAGGLGSGLSPDAVDNMAAFLILNGRFPIGMARSMTPLDMQAVQNRAAEMTQAAGLSPQEFAAAGPIAHTKLAALGQLERARNSNQAFEQMLVLNIQKLKELSAKVSRSGSPYANRSILWLQNNAAGDPDVAEYLFQVNTVQTEAARILSNMGTGGGVLTDSMREEVQSVMNPSYTAAQLNAVMDRAQADAKNRAKSYDDQVNKVIAEIRDPLHKAGGEGIPKAAGIPTFATEADAARANLKPGTKIIVGGRPGTWH